MRLCFTYGLLDQLQLLRLFQKAAPPSLFQQLCEEHGYVSVLQIFGTGYGPLDSSGSAAVQVFAGGVPAEIQFSGPIPQFVGLWQINARLPDGVSGQVPVFVVAGNIASNGVTVWVQ